MIIAAIISSLLSIGLHTYLTLQHFQLKLGLTSGQSFCNINATFNCDAVAISPYAVFWGLPIATWGAMTNFVFLCFLLIGHFSLAENSPLVRRLAVYFSLFISLVSLVMGLISTLALKTYCLNCMGAYALSFLSLYFVYSAWGKGSLKLLLGDAGEVLKKERWLLTFFLLIPAGSYLGHAILADSYGISKLKVVIAESTENWTHAPQFNFDGGNGLILQRGEGPAKMTIVEFADFKCPHCRMAYPTLHAFAEGRPDVRLIYKAFPLDGVCNPDISRKGDGATCKLAFAVFCAEKMANKGWALHHWIFDHQEDFFTTSNADNLLKEGAESLGLDFGNLKSCSESSEIGDKVLAQAKEGAQAKIGGTPTIYVNGKLLERGQFLPVLESVYNSIGQAP